MGLELGTLEEEKVEKRCLKHPYALFRACDAEAIREPYEDMISRVSSFGRYLSLGLDGIELIAYSHGICKNEKDGNHDVRAFDTEAKLSPNILGSTSNSCLWWRSFSRIPSF